MRRWKILPRVNVALGSDLIVQEKTPRRTRGFGSMTARDYSLARASDVQHASSATGSSMFTTSVTPSTMLTRASSMPALRVSSDMGHPTQAPCMRTDTFPEAGSTSTSSTLPPCIANPWRTMPKTPSISTKSSSRVFICCPAYGRRAVLDKVGKTTLVSCHSHCKEFINGCGFTRPIHALLWQQKWPRVPPGTAVIHTVNALASKNTLENSLERAISWFVSAAQKSALESMFARVRTIRSSRWRMVW